MSDGIENTGVRPFAEIEQGVLHQFILRVHQSGEDEKKWAGIEIKREIFVAGYECRWHQRVRVSIGILPVRHGLGLLTQCLLKRLLVISGFRLELFGSRIAD